MRAIRPRTWHDHYNSQGLPKRSYSSKLAARRAARTHGTQERFGTVYVPQEYLCGTCNKWHIGNMPMPREKGSE